MVVAFREGERVNPTAPPPHWRRVTGHNTTQEKSCRKYTRLIKTAEQSTSAIRMECIVLSWRADPRRQLGTAAHTKTPRHYTVTAARCQAAGVFQY